MGPGGRQTSKSGFLGRQGGLLFLLQVLYLMYLALTIRGPLLTPRTMLGFASTGMVGRDLLLSIAKGDR